MNYSIVIPIYKRGDIIQHCLKSISEQSLKPCEIIIVDNNVAIEESNILRNNVNDFKLNNNINIRILSSPKNSGAIARNIGASVSVGEIVAFLDSDVILDKNYYKTLINYFERFDDLIAIQGVDHSLIESQMQIKKLDKFNKFLYKTEQFFETSLIFNQNRPFVSPSLAVAHPNVLVDFELNTEWISTCACLFKKEIFKRYSFPNQFITYSNNEYLFLSYSLFLNDEGRMIYTSKAKYRDIQTNSGRISSLELKYQIQVHDLYIFIKLFKINPTNLLIFIKSRVGHLLYNIFKLTKKNELSIKNLFHAVFSIIYPILNLHSIINGNLSFYEKDFPIKKEKA